MGAYSVRAYSVGAYSVGPYSCPTDFGSGIRVLARAPSVGAYSAGAYSAVAYMTQATNFWLTYRGLAGLWPWIPGSSAQMIASATRLGGHRRWAPKEELYL